MRVRYFAWVRDRIGVSEETVQPPADVTTVGALQVWLGERHPAFAHALEEYPDLVKSAVNLEFAGPSRSIKPTDDVAFFPPVTGG